MILQPSNSVHLLVKPIPMQRMPQATTSEGNHNPAPIFLMTMFAGNWQITYGTKKIMVIIEYLAPTDSSRSSSMPAMRAFGRLTRSISAKE